jgi:hypothetical protein
MLVYDQLSFFQNTPHARFAEALVDAAYVPFVPYSLEQPRRSHGLAAS